VDLLAAAVLLDDGPRQGASHGHACEQAAHEVGHSLGPQLLVGEGPQAVLEGEHFAQALPDGVGNEGRGDGVGEDLQKGTKDLYMYKYCTYRSPGSLWLPI
jgi:hypothetical protein